MLSFQQVSKRYPGGHEALVNVSFEVAAGEMVFISGHSGAGKSTLLKLITAAERPSAGTVLVAGQNVGALGRSAVPFLRRNIGQVFQDQKLLFERNAFDNVALPLEISGYARSEIERRANAALDKVGLLERARALPIELSGGEQQRLCIARAVVSRPSLLLADEPTANLDADYARRIVEILRSFHQVGVTVLVVTHDDSFERQFEARGIRLEAGRVVA
jgi:cell division transport system ATP-binding protein